MTRAQPTTKVSLEELPTNHAEERLESIANEYAELLEGGHSVSPEDFAQRFPDQGIHLLQLLQSIRWIQLAARDIDHRKQPSSKVDSDHRDSLSPFSPRQQLGDYRLIRELGRGGMGIVYEAEQVSLSRRVAVKVLPPTGIANERQVARFAMESQAAAQLQHPHIVPVYAVGCEEGIYFYSMQLIDGRSPQGPMPARDVAQLGVCVAEALEHSHELGIIHRDVKPSNLLVDGNGKVWVTDFGLARCRTSDTNTASGAVLGTLRYMSPEQACGSNLVDHRTDIFSLGVTLYELLTARCPFDATNRSAFLLELERGEPTGIRKLDPSIPVDLETIVLKALSNDPKDRYPTAKAMAEDLKRFVHGEVILARRPSLWYRTSKWISRNQRWVTAAAVMWSLMSVGAIFAAIALVQAERTTRFALAKSQSSLEEADAFFLQAREVVDHFGLALSRQLADVPGAEAARQGVLRDTLRYYRSFMQQAEHNPLRQRDVALTYMKLARVAEQMNANDEAIEAYERSEQLWKKFAPTDSNRGLCANSLGLLLMQNGKNRLADEAFKIAIDCNESIMLSEPANWEARRRQALILTNRSVSNSTAGNSHNVLNWLQSALRIQRELEGDDQVSEFRNNELQFDMGKTYGALAATLRTMDPRQSLNFSQCCVTTLETALATAKVRPTISLSDTSEDQIGDDLMVALCNHAAILNDANELPQAIASVQRALEIGNQMLTNHQSPGRLVHLAAAHNLIARLYALQNASQMQLEHFQRASHILSALVNRYPDTASYRVELGTVSFNLHRSAKEQAKYSVAKNAREVLQSQHQWLLVHAPDHASQVESLLDEVLVHMEGL